MKKKKNYMYNKNKSKETSKGDWVFNGEGGWGAQPSYYVLNIFIYRISCQDLLSPTVVCLSLSLLIITNKGDKI